MITLCPNYVQRRTDLLAAAKTEVTKNVTMRQIAAATEEAVKAGKLHEFLPTKAATLLVFHTETDTKILGGVRGNYAILKEKTKDGTDFPKQVDTAFGQATGEAELDNSYRDCIVEGFGKRVFIKTDATNETTRLFNAIASDHGWEDILAVHTDKWDGGGMSVLSAVKHIKCSDADVQKIEAVLKSLTAEKRKLGVSERELTDFEFFSLKPLLDITKATYNTGSELEKANMHYDALSDEVRAAFKANGEDALKGVARLIFNDLAVATLALNGAFVNPRSFAQL